MSTAAALQLTTLYRTSLSSAKRSYASGYTQSLHDILDVVLLRLQQSPASAPGYPAHLLQQQEQQQQQHNYHHHHHHTQQQRHAHESNREELAWLVRYLQARIEAIRTESEDEEDKETDEEEEEVQAANDEARRERHIKTTLASETSKVQAEHVEEATVVQHSIKEDDISKMQVISRPEKEVEREKNSFDSLAVPSSSSFDFTTPYQSISNFPIASIPTRNSPQGAAIRRKVKSGGGSAFGSSNVTPVLVAPQSTSSVSSEEEATYIQQPQTPSKGRFNRLGKRSSTRDKTDNISKGINAKRRRGMGDRKDDDRRDGGLH